MTNLILSIAFVLTTNWVDTEYSISTLMWPAEANARTYYQSGNVFSNRLATVVIEGETNVVQISCELIGTMTRGYTMSKPERIYTDPTPMVPVRRPTDWATAEWATLVMTNDMGFAEQKEEQK